MPKGVEHELDTDNDFARENTLISDAARCWAPWLVWQRSLWPKL